MKNLIDELHKLDETEYQVSADFSKKVMKKIKKNKNISKINYVISLTSVGAVACLAVVLFNTSNIKSNIFNFIGTPKETHQENAINDIEMSYYDINNASEPDIEKQHQEDSDKTQSANIIFNEIVADNASMPSSNVQNLREETTTKGEDKLAVSAESEKLIDYNKEDYHKIISILENAKIEYNLVENALKVKTSKEKIRELLKNEDLIIEEKEDYILIKLK